VNASLYKAKPITYPCCTLRGAGIIGYLCEVACFALVSVSSVSDSDSRCRRLARSRSMVTMGSGSGLLCFW